MNLTNYNFKPTIIGSMPHTDPGKACRLITSYLDNIPAWPQLPKRSHLEGMSVQFSRGFPGLETVEGKLKFERAGFDKALEGLYDNYLRGDYAKYEVPVEYAAGLHHFLNMGGVNPPMVKGQVTGPVSWCLAIADETGKSILYDEILADAAARMLGLSARWQEEELERISRHTIIMVDEPAMSGYGSAFLSLEKEQLVKLIRETLGNLKGTKGIHCCGNTDWALILSTGIDILSLDAFQYGQTLGIYPEAVKAHLWHGGGIAWGIVPNTENDINRESIASLKDRLEETMAALTGSGLAFKELAHSSLLTPSCSLAGLSEEGAEQVLEMLAGLSARMKARYC